jgi:hypothetical protein
MTEARRDLDELDAGWDEGDKDDDARALAELETGWDAEEEEAAAADLRAGLDPEARRRLAEERAALRKEKRRAKQLAAKEKRKAQKDAIREKQKKPKKRSKPSSPPGVTDAASREPSPQAHAASPSRASELAPKPRRSSSTIGLAVAAALIVLGACAVLWTLLHKPR